MGEEIDNDRMLMPPPPKKVYRGGSVGSIVGTSSTEYFERGGDEAEPEAPAVALLMKSEIELSLPEYQNKNNITSNNKRVAVSPETLESSTRREENDNVMSAYSCSGTRHRFEAPSMMEESDEYFNGSVVGQQGSEEYCPPSADGFQPVIVGSHLSCNDENEFVQQQQQHAEEQQPHDDNQEQQQQQHQLQQMENNGNDNYDDTTTTPTTNNNNLNQEENNNDDDDEMIKVDDSTCTTLTASAATSTLKGDQPDPDLPRLDDIIGHKQVKLRMEEMLLPLALPTSIANSVLTGVRSMPASMLLYGMFNKKKKKAKLASCTSTNTPLFFVSFRFSDNSIRFWFYSNRPSRMW